MTSLLLVVDAPPRPTRPVTNTLTKPNPSINQSTPLNAKKQKEKQKESRIANPPTPTRLSITNANVIYQTPGITAHLPLTASSPNRSTYHLLPLTARGSIAATSFTRKHLAGTHPHPAAIQNPNHSTHSTR